MYPLLISAASTIASKVIDNWNTSKASKAATTTENFAAMLEKNAGTGATAASKLEAQISTLKEKLLNSPEVATLLASADPTKQPTLTLGSNGTLTAQTSDGRSTSILLSAETAATARDLAALTTSAGGSTRIETSAATLAKSATKTSAS